MVEKKVIIVIGQDLRNMSIFEDKNKNKNNEMPIFKKTIFAFMSCAG